MVDREDVMNPAASPARPGVRRVNNVPVAIIGGAVAVFLGIMAFVAAGRAALGDSTREEPAVKSALPLAKSITGEYEAGMVPAAAGGESNSASTPASGNGAAQASQAAPAAKGDGLPAPPPPPGFGNGGGGDVLLPPGSAETPRPGTNNARDAATASAFGTEGSEEERDLHRMKFEMFKQAIRAKTGAVSDEAEATTPSDDRVSGVAAVRAELAAARARAEGGNYMDKLRQLQEAGLLPEGAETPGDDSGSSGSDAYSRFAGDESHDRWALGSRLQAPGSPYELRAGAVIPATLQTGINSDLPGQITAIVAQDVRDTATGKYVLIPQASRLVGTYGSDVQFGQERVLVAWQRIVWPDGKALDIGAMPGSDGAGYAGFKDLVDNHFWRLFGSAVLLSGITGGIAYSQDSQAAQDGRTTVSGAMSQALGQQLGQVSEEMIRKQMAVAPTIEIRPGYRFNVQVTKDLTFNGPYEAYDYQRSISAGSLTFRLGE